MIVPAMSYQEICRQLMEDYEVIARKAYVQGANFQREMLRKKLTNEVRLITYKTAHHNEWNIMFRIHTTRIDKLFYLRTYDKVGPVTYHLQFQEASVQHLIKQNTHFYSRYNERLKLNLSKPADVIKHFFKYNFDSKLGTTQVLENGQRLMQFIYSDGMAIGWLNVEANIIHVKTFISNDIMTNNQKKLIDFINYHEDGKQFEQVVSRKHLDKGF